MIPRLLKSYAFQWAAYNSSLSLSFPLAGFATRAQSYFAGHVLCQVISFVPGAFLLTTPVFFAVGFERSAHNYFMFLGAVYGSLNVAGTIYTLVGVVVRCPKTKK